MSNLSFFYVGNVSKVPSPSAGVIDILIEAQNYFSLKESEVNFIIDVSGNKCPSSFLVVEDFFSIPGAFKSLQASRPNLVYLIITEFAYHQFKSFNIGPVNEVCFSYLLDFFFFSFRLKYVYKHFPRFAHLLLLPDVALAFLLTFSMARAQELVALKARYNLLLHYIYSSNTDSLVLISAGAEVKQCWNFHLPPTLPPITRSLPFDKFSNNHIDIAKDIVIFTSGKPTSHRLKTWRIILNSISRISPLSLSSSFFISLTAYEFSFADTNFLIMDKPLISDSSVVGLFPHFNLCDIYIPQYSWWRFHSPAREQRSLSKGFLFLSLIGHTIDSFCSVEHLLREIIAL